MLFDEILIVNFFPQSVDELPEHMRHLILEPVAHRAGISSPTGPLSPTSDEEGKLIILLLSFLHYFFLSSDSSMWGILSR